MKKSKIAGEIGWQITVPSEIAVVVDKKTKAKTVAFPIEFPSGEHGVVMVTKIGDKPWKPAQDIKYIQLIWNDEN